MHRRAAQLARQVLTAQLLKADGCPDHEFTGRLEREFRRAGAEDLVILLTDGQTPPRPPSGASFSRDSSVVVALEYRGHWIKLSRPHPSSSSAAMLQTRFASSMKDFGAELNTATYLETLSGPNPYESCESADIRPGTLYALHVEFQSSQRRQYYGDTVWQGPAGAELL